MSVLHMPDRYSPLRSPVQQSTSILRTSVSPDSLSPRERHSRERDNNRDPFRAPTKTRSRPRQLITANGNGMLAPLYVPSFVHAQHEDDFIRPRSGSRSVRYVSVGGVWAVGGRIAAVPTQLRGIDTGTGDILASGTNAPMITAEFVDNETEDDKSKAHQDRLAIALDIDLARRVLPISPPLSPTSESS